jgi:outer membrane receptor protein involved in Fe transport
MMPLRTLIFMTSALFRKASMQKLAEGHLVGPVGAQAGASPLRLHLLAGACGLAALNVAAAQAQVVPSKAVAGEASGSSPAQAATLGLGPATQAKKLSEQKDARKASAPSSASTAAPAASRPNGASAPETIVVTARLDTARDKIAPALGAVTYTIGQAEIQSIGQGENGTFQQIAIQAPGAYQDEFGEVHVRGDHGDLQYRVNGIFLPEQLNGFGQEVDPRLIRSVTLIDGSLPAQFGDRTAGIFDITTKTGAQLDGTELSVYGGSRDTFNQSVTTGAAKGNLEYFVSASHERNNIGIDNPTSSTEPLHDLTDQERAFGYFSDRLNDDSRITLLLNASLSTFQIPDTPGLSPIFTLADNPHADSRAVNDHQSEQNYYSVLSYQTTLDDLSAQVSAYTRYTNIHFTPDPVQDLFFDGVAADVKNSDLANGAQAEASYYLNSQHTLRFGGLVTYDSEQLTTQALTFPSASQFLTDDGRALQSSDRPLMATGSDRNNGATTGVYLQDEWSLNKVLTLNYGLRYDLFSTNFDRESQLSPRINLVWKIDPNTTAHIGYSRYFTPPTLQYISSAPIKNFENTTDAPFNAIDGAQKAERSNYIDAGVSRQITHSWLVNVDSFVKFAKNLLDDGQFGNAVILNNFNYATGMIYGAELSTTYKTGPVSLYGNFSYVQTHARNVDSSQYEFPSNELAYIAVNAIQLDHQQSFSGSAGGSYTFQKNTRIYADFLFGDGLRAGFANLQKLPAYYPVNLGVEHTVHLSVGDLKLRFDCLNVFDQVYELRNGSGLGIAAPAYGPRRGFFGGLTYAFN